MKKFGEFVEAIKKDMVIPDIVEERFEETLCKMGDGKKKRSRVVLKVASVAAAFVLVSTLTLISNPAFASKIPFIGSIFGQIENDVTYAGDYSNRQVLTKDSDSKLTAKDKDVTITASEVYSDGFSVYVTLKLQKENYDFNKYYTKAKTDATGVAMVTSYGIDCDADLLFDYDILFEGKNEGKNSFIGMVKFDKPDYSLKDGFVSIKIKSIDLENNPDNMLEGNWDLKIPYQTSQEDCKEISVDKRAKNGFTIKKVFVSPYQLVVFSDIPHSALKTKEYGFYEYAVFTQDGKPLTWERADRPEGEMSRAIFALQGKDVSRIHIYLTQRQENLFKLMEADTEQEAKERSEFDLEVDIK